MSGLSSNLEDASHLYNRTNLLKGNSTLPESPVRVVSAFSVQEVLFDTQRSGVVALAECLPPDGEFRRGKNSAFEPREAGRHPVKGRRVGVDGVFESVLSESFGN